MSATVEKPPAANDTVERLLALKPGEACFLQRQPRCKGAPTYARLLAEAARELQAAGRIEVTEPKVWMTKEEQLFRVTEYRALGWRSSRRRATTKLPAPSRTRPRRPVTPHDGGRTKMKMTDTLEDLMREAARAADQMLNRNGEITPFWLVDTPEETVAVVTPIDASSAEEAREVKEGINREMREFMRERGARRYVFVSESWACEGIRWSSQLRDDDEVTAFVTNVAGAPIQVFGMRDKGGRLYVEKLLDGSLSPCPWSEAIKEIFTDEVEVISGAEAEQLLADIEAERNWDGVSLETHPRRKEVVLFHAEDRTQALSAVRDVVRVDRCTPRLSELKINEDWDAAGRFTGLLLERAVH
jgi:hypothetical protein